MENKESGFTQAPTCGAGFIIINKPVDFTSHDVIAVLRGITGIKKIGHAGTLDPFATGVLICAIGRESTKKIDKFVKLDKEYEAVLRLGAETDTYDIEGKISNIKCEILEKDVINKVLKEFMGKQEQIPPMFSAKKINGQKLYKLARKGKTIERKSCKIEIYDINLIKYKWPDLEIKVKCSTGTYIRSLGHDIGKKLKCGAYLSNLERLAIGDFNIKNAIDLKKLNKNNWQKYLLK